MSLAAISLFVTACLVGTLNDQPKTVCRELQIRHYPTIDACEKVHAKAAAEWLNGIHAIGIDATLRAIRCGPAEAEDGDDI